MTIVSPENIGQPFFLQHPQSLAQTVEKVGGRRVREEAAAIWLQHFLPVPIGPRQFGVSAGRERLARNRVEAHAGGKHQPLLRTGDGDVHSPFIMAIVDGTERRDRVHHEEGGMMRLIHDPAKFGDPARHSGGGLVVNDKHSFNPVIAVGSQPRFEFRGGCALAPVPWNIVDLDAEFFRDLAPELRKVSGLKQEHAIAWRQSVDNRRFPGSRARSWIHYDWTGSLEDLSHAFENFRA